MKKVYQTIIEQGEGNCLQAAVASLFEEDLNDVPHFIRSRDDWFIRLHAYFRGHKYNCNYFQWSTYDSKGNPKLLFKKYQIINALKYDGGINGYFCASVKSQTYKKQTHAVIVNKRLEIVHDPNPNQLALKLTYKDIIGCWVHNYNEWYLDNNNGNLIVPVAERKEKNERENKSY